MKRSRSVTRRGIRAVARCALGVVLAALAVVVELAVWENIPPTPFLLVYPAVVVAAWFGRRTAGVTAILTASFALAYWLFPPTPSFAVAARRDALDLMMFCGVSVVLVELIARVKRALEQANTATRAAEAATNARDTVLAVVAHDLRNPLQTIGLTAELLAASEAGRDERDERKLMRIRHAAARARRLVDDLLDGARIDGDPFPLELASSPLASLVDESLSPFIPIAEARSIELDLPGSGGLGGAILCDRDRIVRVLSNLVGNALQYTPRGGKVAVAVQRSPDGVRFEVSDTGPGMTKDELAHACERLWHGQGPGHGFGLGLWIAKALVEAHGGGLQAASEAGRGTRMSFVVPQPPSPSLRVEEVPHLSSAEHWG